MTGRPGLLSNSSLLSGVYVPAVQTLFLRKDRKEGRDRKERKRRREPHPLSLPWAIARG